MSRDPRTPERIASDRRLADEFAESGTLKHFLLRQGFMPGNEAEAEVMLIGIIRENEQYREKIGDLP